MAITAATCQEPCPGPAVSHPELWPSPSRITHHHGPRRRPSTERSGLLWVTRPTRATCKSQSPLGPGLSPHAQGGLPLPQIPSRRPHSCAGPAWGPGPELGTCATSADVGQEELLPFRCLMRTYSPGNWSWLLSVRSQNLAEQARWGMAAPPEGTQEQGGPPNSAPLPGRGLSTGWRLGVVGAARPGTSLTSHQSPGGEGGAEAVAHCETVKSQGHRIL